MHKTHALTHTHTCSRTRSRTRAFKIDVGTQSRAVKKTHAKKQIEFAMYISVDMSMPIGVPSTNTTFARTCTHARTNTPATQLTVCLFFYLHAHGF